MGVDGSAGGGPAYWAATWLGARETKLDLKLGALPNTVQGFLLPTHHAHTQTHTHTHSGLHNGPTYVALVLWLNSPPCKWSEWSGYEKQLYCISDG